MPRGPEFMEIVAGIGPPGACKIAHLFYPARSIRIGSIRPPALALESGADPKMLFGNGALTQTTMGIVLYKFPFRQLQRVPRPW
ncbi:hypothetical protein FHT02_003860 [Sphingomonas xinjiangensis]|uniref:Uncharacterized protein n=1 Tax=Sphingomonas xinjiangensis TaxID=643568 RepID=A0A840YSF7_9SPHN|nr:hypothetical protein [Sphingomonas xinjiangensis]